MTRPWRAWVLSACLWPCHALAAGRPPDFPAPDDAVVSEVGEEIVVAGRRMTVRAFTTEDTVEEVVEFYEQEWHDPPVAGAPGLAIDTEAIAPWTLLTRVEDDHVMTVQVMPRKPSGAFGFLALGRLPEPGKLPGTPPAPPAPGDSEVLSNILSRDKGQEGQTAIVHNERSLDSNVAFYREHFRDWRVDLDRAVSPDKLHALTFSRGREQVVITIQTGKDGSHIVVNLLNRSLF